MHCLQTLPTGEGVIVHDCVMNATTVDFRGPEKDFYLCIGQFRNALSLYTAPSPPVSTIRGAVYFSIAGLGV
jgi:hypothetical protein